MRSTRARLIVHGAVALLPLTIKLWVYRRVYRYRIGTGVRIGVSIIDAASCELADGVVIGHGNVICQVGRLTLGDHARIGHVNVIRGGTEVAIGRYADILRMNEITAIVEPRVENKVDSTFVMGTGSTLTSGHKVDFTDRVEIGRMTVLGGRHSSLWTHNRQHTKPITIGSWSYIGSEIRMAPGTRIPSRCIVGMGAVVVSAFTEEETMIAGVPAKVVRGLDEDDVSLLEWQPRPDLPPEVMFGPE